MKKFVLVSLMMACLPFLSLAQNANDDLYFIPKKKTEKKEKVVTATPAKVVVDTPQAPTTVYASPGSTVVVRDVSGNVRDIDEYNRRYTSRDNTFSMENDTLYIEEKPLNERGEWVNGFEGSQSDYEYAMRIVRFRNPRFAIPLSSPFYWDVVYALPSWEWNVFDDGYYAYAFPTISNPLWWDWRFSPSWGWGWRSSWYYSSWYSPGFFWGGYWGGWHHHHWHHPHWHHHHYHPHYGWGGVGGYWGNKHGWHGSSARNPGVHAGRYTNNYRGSVGSTNVGGTRRVSANRNSRDNYVNSVRQSNTRNGGTTVRNSSGRVVDSKGASSSVRPQRSATRGKSVSGKEATTTRSNSVYTRPTQGRSSSYNRQSSTRSTVTNSGSSYQRKSGAADRGAYRSGSSSRSSNSRSSYNSGSSRSSSSRSGSFSSGSSSSRSSISSGGGGGGGGRSSGGGGGSRGGGGGRR